MLVAPTLLVGASLVAVAVAVVVEGVVLATAGLLGAIGDEVVQIAAVVAPGVLLPLPVVVDSGWWAAGQRAPPVSACGCGIRVYLAVLLGFL